MKTFNEVPKGIKRKIGLALGMIMTMTVAHVPSRHLRRWSYALLGARIDKRSVVFRNADVIWPSGLILEEGSSIGKDCLIDARGGVHIGKNVTVAGRSQLITGSHNIESKDFDPLFKEIVVEDYAWICTSSIVLQGVRIGRGAVVSAGSVVTKNVPDMCIVGGVPARIIKKRNLEPDFSGKRAPILH